MASLDAGGGISNSGRLQVPSTVGGPASGLGNGEGVVRERPKDLRVVKTIDAIQATFRRMVLEKGLAAVTVKELCEQARINKKTFYRYYPAIEYLLAEVQEQYSRPYIERIEGLSFPQDTEAITRTFFEFSIEQDEFYEAITVSGSHDAIRGQMMADVEHASRGGREMPDGWDVGEWELYLAYVTAAPLRIYQAWLEGGKTIAPQRMVERGVALVMGGARALGCGAVTTGGRGVRAEAPNVRGGRSSGVH